MLAPVVDAEVQEHVLRRLPAQFSESESGAERARENAGVLAELIGEILISERHRRRCVLLIAFIRHEEVQFVLEDRAAEADAGLITPILDVRSQRGELEILRRFRNPVPRLIKDERLTREGIAARFRDGRDDRAGSLVVLRAVVLRDHAELLQRILRERISSARILARDAALQNVVLGADAIDEDVRRFRRLCVAGEGLALRIVR